MMPSPRSSWALLSACALWLFALSGCSDSPEQLPLSIEDAGTDAGTGTRDDGGTDSGSEDAGDDAGTDDAGSDDAGTDSGTDAGPEDAGTDAGSHDAGSEPWDGGYTVLEERGDWIDRGRYAPCTFNSTGAPTSVACDDLSRYDLSQCSPEALAALEPHGIYMNDMRGEARLSDGGTRIVPGFTTFQLTSDGGTDTLSGQPLLTRNTDGGAFFLTSRRTTNGRTTLTALAGCQVPSPGIITGCYARCTDGRFTQAGTFEAHRLPIRRGEPESSGGLGLVSESSVPLGEAVDVFVAKDHAYVVSINKPGGGNGGLSVFDVSDRAHPVFRTSISLPMDSNWNGVWTKDDALYVAGNGTGVIVFDITNPAAPDYVRHLLSGEASAHTVLVDGDRLYSMASEGVTNVHDISRPLGPTLLQRIPMPETYGYLDAHDAFAYQGRLYINGGFGGYSVMDVTDIDNVRHLGQYMHGGYSHHSAVGTFAGRTIAFEGTEFNASHVRVLDVTDPARIVKIGEFRLSPVISIHNMILRGNRLYIAWYQGGLRVLDVSNPTKPRQVAHYNTWRQSDPGHSDGLFEGTFGVRVPGDGYVYLADSVRGLLILNEL